MVWPFSSKEVTKKEFQNLIDSIKHSFTNVKKDVTNVTQKTSQNEESIKELHSIIGYLNQSIQSLNNKVDSLQTPKRSRIATPIEEQELPEIPIPTQPPKPRNILNKITTVQEEMLKKLAALLRETQGEPISAKDLALEMYPETNYSNVRPMISNYLDILEELNLVKKIRKRRQVYIELTEKGESLTKSPITKIKFSRSKRKKLK